MKVKKNVPRKRLTHINPVFTGQRFLEESNLQLFNFNQKQFSEFQDYKEDQFKGFTKDGKVYWLNLHGIHDANLVESLCTKAGIHKLTIQDILDTDQKPKFQVFEGYSFLSLKSILPSDGITNETEQLSFVIGNNFLMTFQEKKSDYFEHIRQRIRENIGIVRQRGSDYLLYLLMEAILENYFKTVEDQEEEIENISIIDFNTDPSPATLNAIEEYKRKIHHIRKLIVPIKEFTSRVEKDQPEFIEERHVKYFLELNDQANHLLDWCESMTIKLDSSINLFFSIQGQRMNQVMKTLTIVATIFIPLTFIAGVYGMNFTNMPELGWKWGYVYIWGVILATFIGMALYFKKKKWW